MMTSEEPKVTNTGRYSTTQTAKALGIHRNTLRKHTELGHIKFGIRKGTARKFYLGYDILKFWRMY